MNLRSGIAADGFSVDDTGAQIAPLKGSGSSKTKIAAARKPLRVAKRMGTGPMESVRPPFVGRASLIEIERSKPPVSDYLQKPKLS